MEKIICISDVHFMGSYPANDKIAKEPTEFGANVFYLGDVWDFSGAKKKKISEMEEKYDAFLKKCKETETITVLGNHESRYGQLQPIEYIKGTVLFTHGHRALWSEKKVERWENKKAGKGYWKRLVIIAKNTFTRHGKGKVGKGSLQKLANYARKRGCSTVICGHIHKSHNGLFDGIRVIVVGRGRTEVMI